MEGLRSPKALELLPCFQQAFLYDVLRIGSSRDGTGEPDERRPLPLDEDRKGIGVPILSTCDQISFGRIHS